MVDTKNSQFVGLQGENITVLRPLQIMTPEEALVHAAWLVAIAGPQTEKGLDGFKEILEAVSNT